MRARATRAAIRRAAANRKWPEPQAGSITVTPSNAESVSFGLGFNAIQHRVESAIEQRLDQAIGRVVAAGGLSLVAFGFVTFGEGESAALID